MNLVVGGAFQGKTKIACREFKLQENQVLDGNSCEYKDIFCCKAITEFHLFVKRFLKEEMITQTFVSELIEKNSEIVIISDEIGYGIVPMDAFERRWREQTGRICCQIAQYSESVIRVVAGLPDYIKSKPLKISLVRHGQTEGNKHKRYIGITDEPLCKDGKAHLAEMRKYYDYPVDQLYVSPLIRCRETAEILFPNQEKRVVEELRECDFGEFENKNYLELSDNPNYQRWIDSGGTLPFPKGESKEGFQKRCVKAFDRIVKEAKEKRFDSIVLVVHGGTIMSILEEYGLPEKKYYEFHVENGCGYTLTECEGGYSYTYHGFEKGK